MSVEDSDFEYHLNKAESYVDDEKPFQVRNHYSAAREAAEREDIDAVQERRLENLRDEAIETSLSQIEEYNEEIPEEDVNRRKALWHMWDTLNEAEIYSEDGELPEKYHELRDEIADEGFDKMLQNSIGILNGEISAVQQPGRFEEATLLAERAEKAREYTETARQMAEYLNKDESDFLEFDHREILDGLNNMAAELGNHRDTAEVRNSFDDLAVVADSYGVSSELVETGLEYRQQINWNNMLVRDVENFRHPLRESEDASVDQLQELEFRINKARREILDSQISEEVKEDQLSRVEKVEEMADEKWSGLE